MVLHCILHCFPDDRPIIRMNAATKIFDMPDICLGWNSEHRFQIAEPGIPATLHIPIPSNGLAGFQSQLQPLVYTCEIRFRGLLDRVTKYWGRNRHVSPSFPRAAFKPVKEKTMQSRRGKNSYTRACLQGSIRIFLVLDYASRWLSACTFER